MNKKDDALLTLPPLQSERLIKLPPLATSEQGLALQLIPCRHLLMLASLRMFPKSNLRPALRLLPEPLMKQARR